MAAQKKVLFVCTGNTCRSPMAEGLFALAVFERDDYELLGSAGVAAYPGSPMSSDTAKILKKRGVVADEFASRPVEETMLEEATHVFAMTRSHLHALVSEFPQYEEKCYLLCEFVEINGRVGVDVPDPIGMGASAYQATARVLDLAIPTLVGFMDQTSDS